MNPQTLAQIRQATNARLISGAPTLTIRSICTNSKEIDPGCLFIALKGENHDGHDYIEAAAKGGAVAAMVHKPVTTDLPLIQVDDTKKAMGRLATHIRRQFKGTVIAVAGSNGKTGTKNLVQAVLKNSLIGTISPKSFNNDIGVPTTIFAASPTDDYLVLEIGTNHPGEILNLTKIAEPDIAIITNIGAEHLEFLGDLDGVARENAEIIAGLNPRGLLVINGDQSDTGPGPVLHRSLREAVATYPGTIIAFGFDPTNDLYPTDIRCGSNGVYFHVRAGLGKVEIFIPLMGRHIAVNALAAIAVARHLGVADTAILAGLSTATGPEMRLQLQTAGSIKILNDAYNANPHSMQAGLETLRDMETNGRRVAILGDMRELGDAANRYHHEIGQFAAACELDHLVCVGENASLIADAAIAAGMDPDCVERYTAAAACAAHVGAIVSEDDLILLKASRGMKLETVAAAISTLAASTALRRTIAAKTRRILRIAPTGANAPA